MSWTSYKSLVRDVARRVIETRVKEGWKGGRVLPVTFQEYLETVSFTSKEIKKLHYTLTKLERLVKAGKVSRARKYGNFLAGSRLMAKAAAHNVLRDRTSPGYGTDLYRKPWYLSLEGIRRMKEVAHFRKRVWLDKPDGSLRPLAIPSLEDRIRERAIVTVAELLAAPLQSKNSIGFRYNQDRHRGLEEFLSRAVSQYGAEGFNIVDTDFRKYYDTIPHSGLRSVMRKVGLKGHTWKYFRSTLTAPVLSNKAMLRKAKGKITGPLSKRLFIPDKGTPQGGVISPLLANLYGSKLDRGLEQLNLVHIRYADNVLVAYPCAMTKEGIVETLNGIKPEGIELHPDKTQYLIGEGTLVTLGCFVSRKGGHIRLLVSEGYDQRKPQEVGSIIPRPFGGIAYVGQILDIVRNLSLHLKHQRSPDRKGWARRVGNLRTYLPKDNNLGVKGGVWRDIKILPQFKGIACSYPEPWTRVKSWSMEKGGTVSQSLMDIADTQMKRVRVLGNKLQHILLSKVAVLSGLQQLHPGYIFDSEGGLYYGSLENVKAKYYRKSLRYGLELAGHIILRHHSETLTGREVSILGKGIGKGPIFLKREGPPHQGT